MSVRRWAVVSLGSAAALVVFAASCAQKPRVSLRIDPPKPIGAPVDPVDADRDGFFDDVDPCPAAAEDGAPPDLEDGCPARSDAGASKDGDAGAPNGSDAGLYTGPSLH